MKKLLIFLFLIVTYISFSQKDTVIDKKYYKVLYSQKLKSPLKLSYKVFNRQSHCDRGGLNFHAEKGVITANNEDFKSNAYDKGHLAPAETFSDSCSMLYETFSYLNCTVQHYKLNRGVWKILEMKEREWAKKEPIRVLVEVIFDPKPKHTAGGAAIPIKFKKTIVLTISHQKYIYTFPNIECTNNLADYLKK